MTALGNHEELTRRAEHRLAVFVLVCLVISLVAGLIAHEVAGYSVGTFVMVGLLLGILSGALIGWSCQHTGALHGVRSPCGKSCTGFLGDVMGKAHMQLTDSGTEHPPKKRISYTAVIVADFSVGCPMNSLKCQASDDWRRPRATLGVRAHQQLACKYCKQRELRCAAEPHFSKAKRA
jgi:hypothetical protein